MSWIVLLGIAVVLIGLAVVTGAKPKGGRPASSTRLMGVGRVVLVLIALVLLYMAWSGGAG